MSCNLFAGGGCCLEVDGGCGNFFKNTEVKFGTSIDTSFHLNT